MLELTVQELKERLEKQELLTEEAMRIAKVAQNEIQEFKKRFIRPTNSLTTNINLQDLLMLSDPPPLPEPLNYHPETPTFNKQLQSQSDFNGFPSTPTTPYQYCSPAQTDLLVNQCTHNLTALKLKRRELKIKIYHLPKLTKLNLFLLQTSSTNIPTSKKKTS